MKIALVCLGNRIEISRQIRIPMHRVVYMYSVVYGIKYMFPTGRTSNTFNLEAVLVQNEEIHVIATIHEMVACSNFESY
jgi:hypothetical protein